MFENRKDMLAGWLDQEETPVFVNSAGSEFQALDVSHLSERLGISVKAYDFRSLISTWALNHELDEIRKLESSTLRHSETVAETAYNRNRQEKPLKFVQKYIEEQNVVPESLLKDISNSKKVLAKKLKKSEEDRLLAQQKNLVGKLEDRKRARFKFQRLGPKQRVLASQRDKVRKELESLHGFNLYDSLKSMRPLAWRKMVVRSVCSRTEEGSSLRETWRNIYLGDCKVIFMKWARLFLFEYSFSYRY